MMLGWFKKISFVFLVGLLVSGCGQNKIIAPLEGSIIEDEFPSNWNEQISLAYDEFVKRNPDTSCFYLLAGKHDTEGITPYEEPRYAYHVSFIIKRDPPPEGKVRVGNFGKSPCGWGMTFEFDEDGQLIGHHYLH